MTNSRSSVYFTKETPYQNHFDSIEPELTPIFSHPFSTNSLSITHFIRFEFIFARLLVLFFVQTGKIRFWGAKIIYTKETNISAFILHPGFKCIPSNIQIWRQSNQSIEIILITWRWPRDRFQLKRALITAYIRRNYALTSFMQIKFHDDFKYDCNLSNLYWEILIEDLNRRIELQISRYRQWIFYLI